MRWKFVIPALILIAIIITFNIIFLDALLKKAFIASGEMAFGAKVEMQSLKTKFSNLSIKIDGLQIADKNDYWKNLIEAKTISFALKPLPLLSKKFIIEKMSVEGVMWQTKRNTSGQLPPKKIKKFNKTNKNSLLGKLVNSLAQKGKSEIIQLPAVSALSDAQKNLKNISINTVINPAQIQTLKEIDTMKADVTSKYTSYQSSFSNLNITAAIESAKSALNGLSDTKVDSFESIKALKDKIDSALAAKTTVEAKLNEFNALKSSISKDITTEKQLTEKIAQLTNADVTGLMDKLKIPEVSFSDISKALFGQLWINRINSLISYVELARKYMPPQKANTNIMLTPSRMNGTNVSFSKKDNPPDFLIQQISLSGTTQGPGKEMQLETIFSGNILNITSDQALLGKPTTFKILGKQNSSLLNFNGTFDHRVDPGKDVINATLEGLSVDTFGLPKSEYLPEFSNGEGKINASLTLTGEKIDCKIKVVLNKLTAKKTSYKDNEEVATIINYLWAGITDIVMNVSATGEINNLKFDVSSNLDRVLSERLKTLFGQKINEYKTQLTQKVNSLIASKKAELLAELNARKNEYQKLIDEKQNELNTQIESIKTQVQAKEDEIKNKTESEKQKAQEELQKQAQDKLKDLFK